MKGVHDVYNEEWDSEGSGEEEEEEGEGERAIEGKFRWEVRYTQIHLWLLQKSFYIKYEFVLAHSNGLQQ